VSLRTILVVAAPFGKGLGAAQIAAAVARGMQTVDSALQVDVCPLDGLSAGGTAESTRSASEPTGSAIKPAAGTTEPAELPARLDALSLDARMHRARAVVIAAERLDRDALLRRGAVFEVATRARQGGVPCCAIVARSTLEPFEARILDLQVVLEADTERGVQAAAGRLLGLV
jgi:glycerate kinase